MNNMSKMGAPYGLSHGKAKADFNTVELARDRHEEGKNIDAIAAELGVKKDTVRDWVYYRTRCYF
jgi:transposase